MTELVTTDKQAMSALKQHGAKIVWAIVIALAGYFGWQFYQKNYAKVDTVAADLYTGISAKSENLALLAQNADAKSEFDSQKGEVFTQIDTLAKAHPDTVYAWQGLMTKARLQADSDDYKGAKESLEQALSLPIDDAGLLAISRLQLVSVLLALDDKESAKSAINQSFPASFEASRLELLGDIYVAENDTKNAQESYEKAWQLLSERHENRALLKLKMQALGLDPKAIAQKNTVIAEDGLNALDAIKLD